MNSRSLEDIKNIIHTVIEDLILKICLFEDLMECINSLEEIHRYQESVKDFVEVKKLLLNIEITSHYSLPRTLTYPSETDDQVIRILFEFFKKMHYSFWEVKNKVYVIEKQVGACTTKESLIPVMKFLKDIQSILNPAATKVAHILHNERESKRITLMQETILERILELWNRIESIESNLETKTT